MSTTINYIVLESTNVALIEKAIDSYFSAPYLGHDGLDIEILEDPVNGRTVLVLPTNMDNELFCFFFSSISTTNELLKAGFTGWFKMDDALLNSTQAGMHDGDIGRNSRTNRVMLTTEVAKDYTVGYSSDGQKIHFHYTGKLEFQESELFTEPPLEKDQLIKIKTVSIESSKPAFTDYSSNQRIIKIALLSIFLLFLLLYSLKVYNS